MPTPTPAVAPLVVVRPGVVEYLEAWTLQDRVAALRRQNVLPDTLLLLEHPHTFTLGRRGHEENILLTAAELARAGIAVHHVDRGGDVTYHGPGQLVGYPILKLADGRGGVVRYLRELEAALLMAIRDLGVMAERVEGFSGVWVGDEKICAIGVKVDAGGITRHGFALNVDPDLAYFDHIIPCGLVGMGVTSLQAQLGRVPARRQVEEAIVRRLGERFGLAPRPVRAGRFSAALARCTLEA